MEKIENTLARLQKEVEEKKVAKEKYDARREKLLQDQKIRQEKMFRQEHEKGERKAKKRMLEERWAMARWIASYIDENSDRWKKEQEERQKDEKKQTEDWLRMNRFVKIKIIRERMEDNTVVEMRIRPAVLPTPARTPIAPQPSPNHNHSQEVHVHVNEGGVIIF